MTQSLHNGWNKFIILILFFVFVGLLYLLSPVILPFFVAALIAYLSNPLVNRLMRFHLPHIIAVIIVFSAVFLVISLLIFFLIPNLVQWQITTLKVQLPNMIVWIQTKTIPWLMTHFSIQIPNNTDILKNVLAENFLKAGEAASWAWQTMLQSGKAFIEVVINFILIPVVTFYLLRDWDQIIIKIRETFPHKWKPTLIKLAKECDSVLSGFFRGQLLVMLSLSIIYSIGLSLIGLQLGVVIGMIAGLMSIVPYLGFIVGVVIAIIAALVQFGNFTSVLWVLLVFVIGLFIENFYLTPTLIGDRIGLHPVVVIFAIMAGGTLFGFFGILLALPVAAIILVLLRHLHQRYANRT